MRFGLWSYDLAHMRTTLVPLSSCSLRFERLSNLRQLVNRYIILGVDTLINISHCAYTASVRLVGNPRSLRGTSECAYSACLARIEVALLSDEVTVAWLAALCALGDLRRSQSHVLQRR